MPRQPSQRTTRTYAASTTTRSTRWVLKSLLQPQGFHEGNQTIWIPKQSPTDNKQAKLTRPTPKHWRQAAKAILAASKSTTSSVRSRKTQRWVLKKTLQEQGYYEGSIDI